MIEWMKGTMSQLYIFYLPWVPWVCWWCRRRGIWCYLIIISANTEHQHFFYIAVVLHFSDGFGLWFAIHRKCAVLKAWEQFLIQSHPHHHRRHRHYHYIMCSFVSSSLYIILWFSIIWLQRIWHFWYKTAVEILCFTHYTFLFANCSILCSRYSKIYSTCFHKLCCFNLKWRLSGQEIVTAGVIITNACYMNIYS